MVIGLSLVHISTLSHYLEALAVSLDLTWCPTDGKHSMPSGEFCTVVRDSQAVMLCYVYKVKADGGLHWKP